MQRLISPASLLVLALLATGAPLSGRQQAAPRDHARPDSLGEIQRNLTNSFLPFETGNRWKYRACEILEPESRGNSKPKPCQSFSESVTQANAGNGTVVTEFRRQGFTSKYSACVSEDGDTTQVYWYLTTRIGVFLACTPAQESFLESELKKIDGHPDHSTILEDPEFRLPFAVGAKWENNWTVTARSSKTVAAGTFDDCYELTQDILTRGPRIEQKRWVCKGIGVVSYEHPGETTGSRYRIELVDCSISGGPKCLHRTTRTPPK